MNVMTPVTKKPVKYQYTLTAEHMSQKKAEAALASSGLKNVHPKIRADEIFTGLYHIRITGTKVQANRLEKAIWEQNNGAFCEIKRGKRI